MHYYSSKNISLQYRAPTPRRLEVSTTGRKHFVKHDDILHVEACGSYSTIYLVSERRLTISKNLKRVDHMLDDPLFFRSHNSQIVNIKHIDQCNYKLHTIHLDNGKEIPLAVRKKEQLKHQMYQLLAS